MNFDQLSVEEYISGFSANDYEIHESLALNCISPSECNSLPANNVSSPCDQLDLIDPQNCGIEKDGLDLYLSSLGSITGNTIVDSDQAAFNNAILDLFGQANYDIPQVTSKSKSILLSQSVGVTMPKMVTSSSDLIQVVHDLEPNYKPRYKSDYFAQDGTIRKPRDQKGNHCVTIKVSPNIQGSIRVDWVTIPTEKNIRYSMPYKFQISNESLEIPDCNPLYTPINADISGIMKLYLVLIKSKQDKLKYLQPFEPFLSFQQVPVTPTLTPKQLIQKYQLDKSQLAFTVCTLTPNGKTYVPDWSTTTYSTVLTEMSVDTSKKRKTTCPKCLHSFEIKVDGADDIGHEKLIKKRKK